jgi:hypothetical protein
LSVSSSQRSTAAFAADISSLISGVINCRSINQDFTTNQARTVCERLSESLVRVKAFRLDKRSIIQTGILNENNTMSGDALYISEVNKPVDLNLMKISSMHANRKTS